MGDMKLSVVVVGHRPQRVGTMGDVRAIGEPIGTKRIGLGRFRYETTAQPSTFIVRVAGIDGPRLLRHSLDTGEAFGEQHPEGWVWITDLRRLIWTSPRSLRYVRRIRRLPNNRGYAVIARLSFRLFGRVFGRVFGAQRFVSTPEQALTFAAEQL
ncbi:MAG TPA: hypothetical protein VNY84_00800 [Acidimicrobiales bacterium]|jgi:hypothetical protein|nr:hypothetical protein [Acidimicrobiales bacterium]